MKITEINIRIDNELEGEYNEIYTIYDFEGEIHVKSDKGYDTLSNGVSLKSIQAALKLVKESINTSILDMKYSLS